MSHKAKCKLIRKEMKKHGIDLNTERGRITYQLIKRDKRWK